MKYVSSMGSATTASDLVENGVRGVAFFYNFSKFAIVVWPFRQAVYQPQVAFLLRRSSTDVRLRKAVLTDL